LPIIETQAGDVSAFVPTNVISITDGQIFLESDLFNAGIRPAINAGLSVSRVGGAAQTKVIKKLGGGVRLALAQFRELAAFSQFASDLDEATRKQLQRGERVTELMKQAQYSPLSIGEMAVSLFAANQGYLDDVETQKVVDFESALHGYMRSSQAALLDRINETGEYNDEIESALNEALKDFKANNAWKDDRLKLSTHRIPVWQARKRSAPRSPASRTRRRSRVPCRWWRPARCVGRRTGCRHPGPTPKRCAR
jgi:F-type H+-transporting ATPase subunit alpha